MSVLVLGTFDGVHIAHRQLITEAKRTGEDVIVCTFDAPYNNVPLLTLKEEKQEIFNSIGVEQVFIESFEDIKQKSPEEYIRDLCERFKPSYIVAGFNHRFGQNAQGTPATLSGLGKKYGFIHITVPPVKLGDEIVSSTLIRNYLLNGKVKEANEMLDRLYSLSGETVHGRHIGTTINIPTVNTLVPRGKLVPQSGVYATLVKYRGRVYKGMTNIGTNPTVSDALVSTVETHIMGFDGDLYGKKVEISFLKKIRDDKKFSSLDELKKQLSDDALLINAYIDTVIKV